MASDYSLVYAQARLLMVIMLCLVCIPAEVRTDVDIKSFPASQVELHTDLVLLYRRLLLPRYARWHDLLYCISTSTQISPFPLLCSPRHEGCVARHPSYTR